MVLDTHGALVVVGTGRASAATPRRLRVVSGGRHLARDDAAVPRRGAARPDHRGPRVAGVARPRCARARGARGRARGAGVATRDACARVSHGAANAAAIGSNEHHTGNIWFVGGAPGRK